MTAIPPGAQVRCPWDQRRLPREMYVKLFVIHFTVIGAFAHLRHLRRESPWPLVYIVILINPIAGLGLILLPSILLPFQTIICGGNRRALRDSTCILLGSGSHNADSEDSVSPEGPSLTWPKPSKDLATKMIVQLALMTQCITSIWLFSRRVKHNSDALYDHKVLQLALLGLSVSVMSMIHLICQPQYPSMAYLDDSCVRIRWLSWLRPLPNPSKWYGQLVLGMMEMFLYWLFAAIILPLAKVVGLMYQTVFWLTVGNNWGMFKYALLLFIPISLGIGFGSSQSFESLKGKVRGTAVIALTVFSLICLLSICSTFIAWLFVTPMYGFFQIWQLLGAPANHNILSNAIYGPNQTITPVPDWDSIWTFGHVPASFPCPEAWKDPMADYVWWLA